MFLLALFSSLPVVEARETGARGTSLFAPRLRYRAAERLTDPSLISAETWRGELQKLEVALEGLERMASMVSAENERSAIEAQTGALRALLKALQRRLAQAPRLQVEAPKLRASGRAKQLDAPTPVDAARFSSIWGAVSRAPFRDEKMNALRQAVRRHYFRAEQVRLLLEALSFSSDRRDALILFAPKIVDEDEIDSLYELLDHRSDRQSARRSIEAARRRMTP